MKAKQEKFNKKTYKETIDEKQKIQTRQIFDAFYFLKIFK